MSKRITTGMRIEAERIGCKPSELGGGNLADARKIDRAITAAVRKERERCVKCAEDEPELPGPMPDEMWKLLIGNRYATQRALVVSVQETKTSIIEAIRKGKA